MAISGSGDFVSVRASVSETIVPPGFIVTVRAVVNVGLGAETVGLNTGVGEIGFGVAVVFTVNTGVGFGANVVVVGRTNTAVVGCIARCCN